MEWNSSMSKRSRALKRAEGMEDPKKWDNKKLGTLSGPRIDVGKIEEWDERERGRAVKYDSGIREIWDWDDGIRCPRPPWAPVGPRAGTKAYLVPRLTPPFWYSTFTFSPSLLPCRSFSSPAFSRALSRLFRLFLPRPFVVPSFLAETRCPVKGSAK